MNKAFLSRLLRGIFLVFITTACVGQSQEMNPEQHPTITPLSLITSEVSSQIVASSLEELMHRADLVIVGQPVSVEGIINTARMPGDISKPDPRFYTIGRVYKVKVDQTLKGEKFDSVLVVQRQGSIRLDSGEIPDAAEIEEEIQQNAQKTFIPLSENTRYLLFLRILDKADYDLDGYKSASLYAGVMEPWLFVINADKSVVPETLVAGLGACFPLRSFEEIIEDMEKPYIREPCENPYPAPSIEVKEADSAYPTP